MSHELDLAVSHDGDMQADPKALSRAGQLRRSAMLHDLQRSMQALHRRRRSNRRIVAGASFACLLVALALLATSLLRPPTVTPVNGRIAESRITPQPRPSPGAPNSTLGTAFVVRVATDPAVLDRYRARPPRIVKHVGDDGLLRALAAMDRPAGLIRVGDAVRLTAPVTDDELQ